MRRRRRSICRRRALSRALRNTGAGRAARRAQLREELGARAMAGREPPPRRALASVNRRPDLVERRRRDLEQWLWRLVADPELARARPLNAFLELSDAARLVQRCGPAPAARRLSRRRQEAQRDTAHARARSLPENCSTRRACRARRALVSAQDRSAGDVLRHAGSSKRANAAGYHKQLRIFVHAATIPRNSRSVSDGAGMACAQHS